MWVQNFIFHKTLAIFIQFNILKFSMKLTVDVDKVNDKLVKILVNTNFEACIKNLVILLRIL